MLLVLPKKLWNREDRWKPMLLVIKRREEHMKRRRTKRDNGHRRRKNSWWSGGRWNESPKIYGVAQMNSRVIKNTTIDRYISRLQNTVSKYYWIGHNLYFMIWIPKSKEGKWEKANRFDNSANFYFKVTDFKTTFKKDEDTLLAVGKMQKITIIQILISYPLKQLL